MWIHPARFNEDSPVRAADLNDLAVDHEVLLGDVARANLALSSPIWEFRFGGAYKDLALWYRVRYLWMRITIRYTNTASGFWQTHTDCYPWWSFTINGVEVVRRQWETGWTAEHTWTEIVDLTTLNLTPDKIYDCLFDYDMGDHGAVYGGVPGYPGEPSPTWVHLKAIHELESI